MRRLVLVFLLKRLVGWQRNTSGEHPVAFGNSETFALGAAHCVG